MNLDDATTCVMYKIYNWIAIHIHAPAKVLDLFLPFLCYNTTIVDVVLELWLNKTGFIVRPPYTLPDHPFLTLGLLPDIPSGWEYEGMQEFCYVPPCEHATYCRGTSLMVKNCMDKGYQGARYDDE